MRGKFVILTLGLVLGGLLALSRASTPVIEAAGLLQFGCSWDYNVDNIPGPVQLTVGPSGSCANTSYGSQFVSVTPVPGGSLYGLRFTSYAGTTDGSNPNMRVTVHDGSRATLLTCSTGSGTACRDLTHRVPVKSGDTIWISLDLPTSANYLSWASATVEFR